MEMNCLNPKGILVIILLLNSHSWEDQSDLLICRGPLQVSTERFWFVAGEAAVNHMLNNKGNKDPYRYSGQ